MTTCTTLTDAMDMSRSHNEIVAVEWDGGDSSALIAELGGMHDGEIDSVDIGPSIDSERPVIDVWGYDADAPEGDMEWRLYVTLVA